LSSDDSKPTKAYSLFCELHFDWDNKYLCLVVLHLTVRLDHRPQCDLVISKRHWLNLN
jgi:hypothetical protein